MTGFGSAAFQAGGTDVNLELRSVNSRHLKINFRLPLGGEIWEQALREEISAAVRRGHVDVTLRLDDGAAAETGVHVDERRLKAWLDAFEGLRSDHGVSGEADLALLARCDGIFVEGRASVEPAEVEESALRAAVGRALDELVDMREREGARLAEEFRSGMAEIARRLDVLDELAPARLETERDRQRTAVAELTEGIVLDDDRVAREIAILADRWDVREELVRARSHLAAFEELLEAPAGEPVGKRMGFLSQELLREINTIGSKANDAAMARHVVEAKNALESLREQLENVE